MSDEHGESATAEDINLRLVKIETQRNGALGLVVLFAGAMGAGAWDVAQKTTRLDERVTRMAVDVQSASAAAARIDRMEERLTSMNHAVDRIEAEIPRVRESLDALRSDITNNRIRDRAAVPDPSPPRRVLGMFRTTRHP
jgi:chromosome segregation ATPase